MQLVMQDEQAPRSRRKMDSINLTVCGSFGFGNAGDEAIPDAIFDMAAQLGIPVELMR